MTRHDLDFAAINAAALRLYPGLLCQWFPGGVLHGVEYDVLNPSRDDRTKGSFRINTQTGEWADFAAEQRGTTPITLYANFFTDACNSREAAEQIARQLGMMDDAPPDLMVARLLEISKRAPKKDDSAEAGWAQIPVDDAALPPPLPGNCPAWTYTTAEGQVLGYVVRIPATNGGKRFIPVTYWENDIGQRAWKHRQFVRPLPLYNRLALEQYPDWPVLVVEGEKTADAGQALFENTVVVSWPQGSSSAAYVDWSPLKGRQVCLLPDHDEPGRKAMRVAAEKLSGIAAGLWRIDVEEGRPAGWDVADGDWATPAEATAWLDRLPHVALPLAGGAGPADAKAAPSMKEDRIEAALKRANGKGPVYSPHAESDTPVEPLPIPLLAQLEADLNRRVHIAHPLAAQQAALAIAAHACARQGLSTSNDPCSLSLALCAQSVGLLRPYLAEVAKLFEAAKLQKSIRATRISTPISAYKLLYTQPALLYLSSEYGAMLQFAKRQPAGTLEQALNVLSELYDAADQSLDLAELGIKGFDADQDVLRSPTINLLALISQEQMATAMKASELGRGALEQMQTLLLDEDHLIFNDPESIFTAPFDPALIAMIQRLRRVSETPMTGNPGYQRPDFIIVRWGADMKTVYPALDELAKDASRAARPLIIAARSHIRRVCTVLAMWANPDAPVITPEILAWTARREVARLKRFLAQFNLLASDDGKTSVYQKVLAAIHEAKHHGMTIRNLQQQCWAFRSLSKDKREECLNILIEDGDIVGLASDGKRVTTYYGSAFVKAQGAVS